MFEHSVRVPRLYKTAAQIAKKVSEDGASIKGLVYERKHPNIKALYALVVETLQRKTQLEFLFKKSQILVKEPRLEIWLAKVLITELLWGKKKLAGEAKPIKTVLAYQQIFNAHADEIYEDVKTKVYKPRYVRVNTLKLSINEAIDGFRDEGWIFNRFTDVKNYKEFLSKVSNLTEEEFMTDVHIDDLLVFPETAQFYKHGAYLDGSIVLQDKASCLPVQILKPTKGSTVLDMCAAPGMKTSQLAAAIENEGVVYAIEKDVKRMETLKKLVESTGATCVKPINKDVLTITEKDIPGVEYILVDPSCSGSGIVDRIETSSQCHIAPRLEKLAGFQIKILKHALRSFPTAKRIVYSTCSVYPEENEAVIKEVISGCRKYKLVPAQELLNGTWYNYGSSNYGEIGGYCLYSKPEEDLTNGFFVAVFERLEEGEENPFLVVKEVCKEIIEPENIATHNETVATENEVRVSRKRKASDEKNKLYNETVKYVETEKEISVKIKNELNNVEETPKISKRKHSKVDIIETTPAQENKKKKSKHTTNDQNVDVEIKTKKSKKREGDETNISIEIKQKKKRKTDESHLIENSNVECIEEISVTLKTKKKKSKSHVQNDKELEISSKKKLKDVNESEESPERPKKKKKSKHVEKNC